MNLRRRFPDIAAAALLALLLLATLACGVGGNGSPSGDGGHGDGDILYPRLPKVTGHIDRVDAQPDNARHFSRMQITDDAGRRWQFRAEGWVGVSVGHLKDHQIQGTPVTVWYEPGDGAALPLARFVGD